MKNIIREYPLPQGSNPILSTINVCDVIPHTAQYNIIGARVMQQFACFITHTGTHFSVHYRSREKKVDRCSRVRRRGCARRGERDSFICETPTAELTLPIIFHRYEIFPSPLSLPPSLSPLFPSFLSFLLAPFLFFSFSLFLFMIYIRAHARVIARITTMSRRHASFTVRHSATHNA